MTGRFGTRPPRPQAKQSRTGISVVAKLPVWLTIENMQTSIWGQLYQIKSRVHFWTIGYRIDNMTNQDQVFWTLMVINEQWLWHSSVSLFFKACSLHIQQRDCVPSYSTNWWWYFQLPCWRWYDTDSFCLFTLRDGISSISKRFLRCQAWK